MGKIKHDLYHKSNDQTILFRVNCIDSIDRTNNVLALLTYEIIKYNISNKINTSLNFKNELKKIVYDMFVINGDLLSQ